MKASNPPKDKRTKAYKEWKAKYDNQSKGLGDTVAKFTKATGIKKVVDTVSKITKKPCNCGKRKDTLNRLFPYNK